MEDRGMQNVQRGTQTYIPTERGRATHARGGGGGQWTGAMTTWLTMDIAILRRRGSSSRTSIPSMNTLPCRSGTSHAVSQTGHNGAEAEPIRKTQALEKAARSLREVFYLCWIVEALDHGHDGALAAPAGPDERHHLHAPTARSAECEPRERTTGKERCVSQRSDGNGLALRTVMSPTCQ